MTINIAMETLIIVAVIVAAIVAVRHLSKRKSVTPAHGTGGPVGGRGDVKER